MTQLEQEVADLLCRYYDSLDDGEILTGLGDAMLKLAQAGHEGCSRRLTGFEEVVNVMTGEKTWEPKPQRAGRCPYPKHHHTCTCEGVGGDR